MPKIIQGPAVKNQPIAYPSQAGETVTNRFSFAVVAGAAAPVATDIIELGIIPANCRPVDAYIDVDAAVALTVDIGVMSGKVGAAKNPDGSDRTCGNEFWPAEALAVGVERMSNAAGFRVAPAPDQRSIGMKVTAGTAAAGVVSLVMLFAT